MGLEFDYPEGATPLDPDEADGLMPSLSTQGELNGFEALNIIEEESCGRGVASLCRHMYT